MRYCMFVINIMLFNYCFAQSKDISGTYTGIFPEPEIIFNADSTFAYNTKGYHPNFYPFEKFSEKGRWTLNGDTIILNPQLAKKTFVESSFAEEQQPGEEKILLTFNHIKRYFDAAGNIIKTDTVQITQLDYAFNELKKKNITRVTPQRTVRCAFAGYIPKEIITNERSISVTKPGEEIQSIHIGCYELQNTKEYIVHNPLSNHFTFNVYSNYYDDGQLRQVKLLVKNNHLIYTRQKENGQFEKDNIWSSANAKLKKQKSL